MKCIIAETHLLYVCMRIRAYAALLCCGADKSLRTTIIPLLFRPPLPRFSKKVQVSDGQ